MRFEALREILLKGGVAPRHVRRYLAELTEHLDDLTEKQRALGYEGEDAQLRARALLGEDRELAAAMLEQQSLRSIAARAPWLIFGILPPFAAIAALMLPISALVLTAKCLGLNEKGVRWPEWFGFLAVGTTTGANLLLMPLVSALFVALAARQRQNPIWPLLATLMLLILLIHSGAHIAVPGDLRGSINVGVTPIFLAGNWKTMGAHWPTVAAQYVLTLLPLFWLVRRRLTAR